MSRRALEHLAVIAAGLLSLAAGLSIDRHDPAPLEPVSVVTSTSTSTSTTTTTTTLPCEMHCAIDAEGHWLNGSDAVASFRAAEAEYGPIDVDNCGRTPAEQRWLLANGYPATSVELSWHVKGRACDLDDYGAKPALKRHGWCEPYRHEPWHVSFGGCG